ncbi:MAG: alpha-amylase family glycosyl hydrolase [Cyclobacteriaceae bacterium]
MSQAESMNEKKQKIVVYQLITRLFGNTKTANKPFGTIDENGVGKFNDITDTALIELKKLGISHVWYTGIIEHAVLTDYTEFGIPLDDADVVKGRAGSPYAIKDYYDVNPDLATEVPSRMAEFEALVKRTHSTGLKVLIDFVPNHVARAYFSDAKPNGISDFGADDDLTQNFSPQNNFYYLPNQAFQVPTDYLPLGDYYFPTKDGEFDEQPAKATGNDQFTATPSKDDWFETVKLNYGVDYQNGRSEHFEPIPDTWNKMLDILKYWTEKGVDGFRCDMAQMVPVAFWNWVIPKIKAINPEILFIAEIYEADRYRQYLFDGKFDFLYDKVELYDTLRHIVQGQASTDDITSIWQRQEGISQYMLRFLENHDEQRIASPFFANDPMKAIPAMVVSATMHTGPVMIYFGQEVGEPGAGEAGFSGDDGRTTHFDYWGVPEHQKWMNEGKFDGGQLSDDQKKLRKTYSNILNLAKTNTAINSGEFYDLHYFNRSENFTGYSNKVYAYLRYTDKERLLIVVNFSDQQEECLIKIPKDAFERMGLEGSLNFTDVLGDDIFDATVELVADHFETESLQLDLKENGWRILSIANQ